MCIAVYRLTEQFPRDETYCLTAQLKRASTSVASNIAEGYGRLSREQYRYFLGIAQGSNFEVQTQLVIAAGLGLADSSSIEDVEVLSCEVGKMLTSMLRNMPAAKR